MSTPLPQRVFTQAYRLPLLGGGAKRKRAIRPGWGTTPSWVVSGMLEKMEPGFCINRPTTMVNEVSPAPTVTFMGRKLPMVKTAFGRKLTFEAKRGQIFSSGFSPDPMGFTALGL